MRVENFRWMRSAETVRVTADVVWEDARRAPFSLFYEGNARFAADFSDDANAFLCSVALSASRDGETRILLERPVSPRLADGVTAALSMVRRWYGGPRSLPRIESAAGFKAPERAGENAALCLTGGVDSLHTLWSNRNDFSASEPAAFRRAMYIVHLSFPPGEAFPRARDVARRQLLALQRICEETGLELSAVRTNVRLIEPSMEFTQAEGLSSLLSAAAHFQSGGVSSISIASSSYDESDFRPWGTHPDLDALFSSEIVEVIHRDAGMTRTDKVRRIAAWKPALENLSVCFEGPVGDSRLNCGRCEKCLRTMVALLAIGALERTGAFGGERVTPESIRRLELSYEPNEFPFLWEPLRRSMEEIGRRDLAEAIRRRLADARRYYRWRDEEDWKGRLRRFDRRILGGRITSASRRVRGLGVRREPL